MKNSAKKPLFIVFEGIDGAGKSTVMYEVARLLRSYTNRKIIQTREPGGNNCLSAEKIRSLLLDNLQDFDPSTTAYLYAASRNEHLKKVLLPNLVNDNIVLCDRFVFSSYVYQGIGQKIGLDQVIQINANNVNACKIDYVFYFDINQETALLRRGLRERLDYFDQATKEWTESLLVAYPIVLAKHNHDAEVITINANLEFNEVVNQVLTRMLNILA